MKKSHTLNTVTLCICLLIIPINSVLSQKYHQQFKENKTLDYDALIEAYKLLDQNFEQATMKEFGLTDCGKKLQLFCIKNPQTKENDPNLIRILINNGIHPGEPDGMDASLLLAEKILNGKITLPANIYLGIIPVYNIDGMLNRGCCSRANQNGPEEYGFRGNSKNLDLNRDFIKADSKNAQSFYRIFHSFRPDILVDTHVSNGADYQYTMTLLATQMDKLGPNAEFCRKLLLPELYQAMEKKFPMTPYVNTLTEIPDDGIVDFLETPRFATGYAALFGVIGLTTETHMFKPYEKRVESTFHFLEQLILICDKNSEEIKKLNTAFREQETIPKYYKINWQEDTTKYEMIDFMGYVATYPISSVTQQARLKYDTKQPYTKKIKYFNRCSASDSVEVPKKYIIPQAWSEVIERLYLNQIKIEKLEVDQELEVHSYYIKSYKTSSSPYEGHYLHRNVETETRIQKVKFYKGDFVIPIDQSSWRYIVETLEPKNVDSFFNWGFFDAILQQKEHFSSYVFIDYAEQMLKEKPELKIELENKIKNKELENNSYAILNYLYKKSPYYEISHNRYPVYRIF